MYFRNAVETSLPGTVKAKRLADEFGRAPDERLREPR
jgi:hypothetical protein